MNRDIITLEPEVEEILREVARRPGSALLRVPRKDVARTVLERDTLLHARTAGLSSAERHLVQVYREELAFALRQAAYYQLAEGTESRNVVIDRVLVSRRDDIPSVRKVRATVSEALGEPARSAGDEDAIELLERCVGADAGGLPGAGELAAASHRLVPTNQARIYVGVDFRARGEWRSALGCLTAVLQVEGSIEHRRAAWLDITDVYLGLGRPDLSLGLAKRYEGEDSHPALVINRLLSATAVRDVQEVAHALRSLDRIDTGAGFDLALHEFLREWSRGRANQIDAGGVTLLLALRDEAGRKGQELIDVLVG